MAPVEFEKHIKERFEKRRIDPSSDSWNKIAGQLDAPIPSRRSAFNRYGFAAAIVGILLAVTWVFTSESSSVLEGETVVEEPGVQDELIDPIPDNVPDQNATPLIIAETEGVKKEEINQKDLAEDQIVQREEIEQIEEQPSFVELVTVEENLLIENKISEMVARVSLMESGNDSITEAEVESLLMNAQQELLADKNFREGTEVNANALLAGVEDELDKTFRDQVFERLKQGFIKVRTAVADRNK